jgi:V/A-type H+-transporting ATPase subunit E
MRQLADRLYRTAQALLRQPDTGKGDELFVALAGELPDFPWETVKVNSRDKEAASSRFPKAKLIVDDANAIRGGLEVSGENGAIRIINTLEKRLERMWPELLPELIAAAYREIGEVGEIGRDVSATDR